jgi:uncharacterized membrane protein
MSTATLRQAKAMGGVGSIFMLLFFVPMVGFILGIVGLVMTLLAVKQISDVVNDREIFNNVLMAIILQIVGIGIFTFILLVVILQGGVGILGGLLTLIVFGIGVLTFTILGSRLQLLALTPSRSLFDGLATVFAIFDVLIVGLIVVWIVLIFATRFLRKGYERIATKTGTEMFRKVGRWYYYGAWLVIVLVGFIIAFVALILQIVAFFSLPESPPSQPASQVQTV